MVTMVIAEAAVTFCLTLPLIILTIIGLTKNVYKDEINPTKTLP